MFLLGFSLVVVFITPVTYSFKCFTNKREEQPDDCVLTVILQLCVLN